ncbi:MAG: response regulator [Pseudanabaenales cyanobacterium]|nr:response regulator [Pseudanabaenales cyanobacterium]
MSPVPMASYQPSQKLQPLSLLAQFTNRRVSGCLRVSTESAIWSIYFERGKLVYASNSVKPFDRLDRQLRRLGAQVPTLGSATRLQMRLLFEPIEEEPDNISSDYQAICWLVAQQHLHPNQAATLIGELAKETMEPFLLIREGCYELIETEAIAQMAKFCQLDLRSLVESCHNQLQQKRSIGQATQPIASSSSLLQHHSPRNLSNGAQSSIPIKPSYGLMENRNWTAPSESLLEPSEGSTKKTYTIACIDDSPTVLSTIHKFLDDTSFSVITINDPVKALMQIIRSKPDLILLDVTMPNLDGYELCALLRRHPDFKNTPIVMVTGNTGLIDRARAKLVRASGYLTKPFEQSDLLKMVFQHLSS